MQFIWNKFNLKDLVLPTLVFCHLSLLIVLNPFNAVLLKKLCVIERKVKAMFRFTIPSSLEISKENYDKLFDNYFCRPVFIECVSLYMCVMCFIILFDCFQVILRVISPSLQGAFRDPYSPQLQDLLKMTNLRINFTKLQTLGDDLVDNRDEIKVLLIKFHL